MPRLIDALGKMSIGNKKISAGDIYKKAQLLPNQFPRPPLSIKNQLKTTVQLGGENFKGNHNYGLEEQTFADWCSELNRQPKTACFSLCPISKVKPAEDNELKTILSEFNLSKWIQEVDERINNWFLKN